MWGIILPALGLLAAAISATSIDKILHKDHFSNVIYDDGCDGLICDQFVCVPHSVICDQQENCDDGTDEIFCPCLKGSFLCHDGHECVPDAVVCDDNENCDDGSDEWPEICDAEGSGDVCSEDMIACSENSTICIDVAMRCDGKSDCTSGQDEQNCETFANPTSTSDDLSFDEVPSENENQLSAVATTNALNTILVTTSLIVLFLGVLFA